MRTIRRFRLAACTVALLASTGGAALAQTGATAADLSGTVFDESRAVVAGAVVTATNKATGLVRGAVSQRNGRFAVPALPPGTYSVKIESPGYRARVAEVALALGEAAERNFVLQVGSSETVTVVGTSPQLDPRRTAVSTVLGPRHIDGLPTNGRDFLSFSVLTPGVSTDRTPYQGAVATSGLTFAGQRARSNNITVDGLDNNDITVGAVRATFSQEAVQEFQVVANSFSAEFGKATGGVVNIITKSGTNTLAGNVFGFFRDDALNAKEHFEEFLPDGTAIDQPKAAYGRSQFGATLGGPIRRDRTFFFLSSESLRSQANNFVNIDNTSHITVFGRDYGTLAQVLERDGFLVPLGHLPYHVDSDQVLAKVDTAVTDTHRLAIRFNWGDRLDENAERWGGKIARSRGASLDSRDLTGAASVRSTLSAVTFNELRFQVAYRNQNVVSFDPKCSGACDGQDEGGPTLEIGATAVGRQRFTPQPRKDIRYELVDVMTRHAGRHQLKAGVDFSCIDTRLSELPLHFGGRYTFLPLDKDQAAKVGLPGAVTAEEALALGAPYSYLQGYGNAGGSYGYTDISLFAEDEWRAADRLTLTFGVRYQNQFWQQQITENVPDVPPYRWPTDNNNVAPRLGVSWDPTGDKKAYVHGFYGVSYDNHITSLWGLASAINGTPGHVETLSLSTRVATALWSTADRKSPKPAGPFSSFAYSIQPGLKTPYAHHVSAGLDREFAGGVAMAASVMFVRGFNHVGNLDYNVTLTPCTPISLILDGISLTSSRCNQVWRQYTSWGQSWYRGLTVSLRKRFASRYGFLASYTWSKAEDLMADFAFQQPQDGGDGRNPDDPNGLPLDFDPMLERGPSLQDQRHRVAFSGSYTLPRDFTVSTIVIVGSGRPFNILARADLNDNKDVTGPSDRPWRIEHDPTTQIGRNAGLMPATSTVDLRVAKRLGLGGRARLDLMVDLFNLFNRTNYTQVDNVFGGGSYPADRRETFGQFTEAAPPFQAQLGVKITF